MNTNTLLPMPSNSFSEMDLKTLCVVFLCLGSVVCSHNSVLLHARACHTMASWAG